ncbi:MAG: winged helix-turn-helix transcriptional regulator [Ruminococcaceae bacterium]|nr:winged helix-turn-helix transcriptional regulator [Oscillospiraceae bacterium]
MDMKNLQVGYLLDFYGGLLPEKRQEILELYYEEDLSLGEIAERTGMTRQGVRDHIKRAERQLGSYEENLRLAQRFQTVALLTEKIREIAQNSSAEESDEMIALLDEIDKLL